MHSLDRAREEWLTALIRDVRASSGVRYRDLAAALRSAIVNGELPVGTKLPPQRELASLLSIGRTSVVAAYNLCAPNRSSVTRQGAGTWVARRPASEPRPSVVRRNWIGASSDGRLAGARGDSSAQEVVACAPRRLFSCCRVRDALSFAFPGVASAASFTVLHSFSGPEGETPAAPLVQGADGFFYGVAAHGGDFTVLPPDGGGTVFRMDANGTVTTLHTFRGPEGAWPKSLIQGRDGFFYGTAT